MKQALLCLAALTLLLTACNRPAGDTGAVTTPSTAPPATAPTAAKKPRPKPISAEEIAQIEATGQTGLWSDVTEVCSTDAKTRVRAMLTWNVKASGADKVVLYVVGKDGKEHNFARGGAVGHKQTGPWVKAGATFKLRRLDNKEELGSVVIGEKQC